MMTRALVYTAVTVALLGGLAACGGPAERKAKYRERAEQHIADRNYPKARVALRNILKIDPNDAEAHYLFAQIEEKEKNWRNAVANYERVVELTPTHKGARIRLAKYYLEVGALDKVEESAAAVLGTVPNDPDALALRIAAQAVRGEGEEALNQARLLVQANPTANDPGILLATLLSRRGQHADAEGVLRELLRHHPGDLELLSILATTLIDGGRLALAEDVYRQLITIEPHVYDHRLRLALLHDRQTHLDDAERVLREAVSFEPKSERRHLTLIDFMTSRRGPHQGEQALAEAQQALPTSTAIQLARGTFYQRTEQFGKARAVYDALVREHQSKPTGLDANVRLAALDLLEGRSDRAVGRIQDVLRENPRAIEALLLQGKIALLTQDGKTAINAFRTVVKDQPENAEGHLFLGEAYLLTQEPSLARDMFEQAVALNPELLRAHRALAALDVQDNRPIEAKRRLEAVLKRHPSDPATLDLLLSIAVAEEDWASADSLMARLRQSRPDHYETDMSEGLLHEVRRRYDQAAVLYERASAKNPAIPDPLVALVKTETTQGQSMNAKARLEALLERQPTHVYGHGLLGELLIAANHVVEGEAHLRQATQLKPEWSSPWIALATAQLAKRQPTEAIHTLEQGLTRTHGALDLRMMLASVHTQTGQIDQAIQDYEAILRDRPRTVLAANNLASLLTEYKGDAVSLERALAVSKYFERGAPNPVLLDTLGAVHLKMGHHQEAVRLLRQAVDHAPNHPLLNYHLGLAYYGIGDSQEAKKHLGAAVKTGDLFDGRETAQQLLAQLGA